MSIKKLDHRASQGFIVIFFVIVTAGVLMTSYVTQFINLSYIFSSKKNIHDQYQAILNALACSDYFSDVYVKKYGLISTGTAFSIVQKHVEYIQNELSYDDVLSDQSYLNTLNTQYGTLDINEFDQFSSSTCVINKFITSDTLRALNTDQSDPSSADTYTATDILKRFSTSSPYTAFVLVARGLYASSVVQVMSLYTFNGNFSYQRNFFHLF